MKILKKNRRSFMCILKKGEIFLLKLALSDKLKRKYEINPNEAFFILQKKAELLYPFLMKCKGNRDLNGARAGISKLLNLIALRSKMGIADGDPV